VGLRVCHLRVIHQLARQRALLAWDGEMRAESAGAAVYGRLMPTLQRRLYGEALGDVLDEFLGLGQHAVGQVNIFWGRVAHALFYLAGIPWLRTVVWAVSIVGLAMIFVQLV
jgi:hypothetical protein